MEKIQVFSRCYRLLSVIVFLAFALVLSEETIIAANASYPSKPIVFIVPYGVGGGADLTARAVAPTLNEVLGVPIIIRNVVGARGQKGVLTLYRAASDGYTISMINLPGDYLSARLYLSKEVGKGFSNLSWLGILNFMDYTVFVKTDGPYQSLKDLIAAPRVKFSTPGGSSPYFIKLLIDATGIKGHLVTGYKSSSESVLAVARGDTDVAIHGLKTGLPLVRKGLLKPILYFASKRNSEFPAMQTVREAGYPELEFGLGYRIIAAPPNLAVEKVKILNKAVQKAILSPSHLSMCKKLIIPVAEPKAREAAANEVRRVLSKWGDKLDLFK